MNWLHKLLTAEAPENTTLAAAELTFRGLFPWWLGLVLLLGFAWGVFALYARERPSLASWRRWTLAAFRGLLVALALFLLLRPVLLAEFAGDRPRQVVLLLDNSQSMDQKDRRVSTTDRMRAALARRLIPLGADLNDTAALAGLPAEELKDPSRADLVRHMLAHPDLRLLDGLRTRGPLRAYTFGQALRPLDAEALTRAEVLPTPSLENHTALADALHTLLTRAGADRPAAVVVVTDGRENASKLSLVEAAQACKEAEVPLHVWGVGSSESTQLQLKDVLAANTLFAEDKVAVTVRWRARGVKQGKAVVRVGLGDQKIEAEVDVSAGGDFQHVLTLVPDKGKEIRELTAAVELRGSQGFGDSLSRRVRVLDNRVKVLYVEHSPRWEYKFLQPALLRDRRVEARFLLTEADPEALKSGLPYLEKFPERFPEAGAADPDRRPFDLLILGDVPVSALGTDATHVIQRFVREGGGLVCISGRQHFPAEYLETPLAEVLPVEFNRVPFRADGAARPQPFRPLVTPEAEHSEWAAMLALADTTEENARMWREELWKEIRGFYWHYPVTRLRPGARPLLVHPELRITDRRGDQPMPLVAAHHYGKGQVLFLATDETWRWRYNGQEQQLARFWGQVIYQMGLPHLLGNSERLQLRLAGLDAVVGRSGYLYARLLDEKNEPLKVERVLAKLEQRKDSAVTTREIEFRPVAGQDGEYQALVAYDQSGQYEVKDLRTLDGLSLPSGSLQYFVDYPPRHELELAGLAEDELREVARLSGGRFYREEDLPQLAESITPRATPFTVRQEIILWNPLVLLLFVVLITAEWMLRKVSNLS